MKFKLLAASVFYVQILTACGGGGGGSTSNPGASVAPVAPLVSTGPIMPVVALDAAITDLYANPHRFDRSQTDPATGNVYHVVADFVVGPDAVAEGVSAKTVTVTRVVTKNAEPPRSVSERRYFQVAPYKLIAVQSLDSPFYLVASMQVPLAQSAKAGQSGAFYNATIYDSAQKQTVISTSTNKWEVTEDPGDILNSVTYCVNTVSMITNVPGTTPNSECYKVTQPGSVTAVGFTIPR